MCGCTLTLGRVVATVPFWIAPDCIRIIGTQVQMAAGAQKLVLMHALRKLRQITCLPHGHACLS